MSAYLRHFGLKTRPFPLTPENSGIFVSDRQKSLLDSLVYVLENEDGIVKVTGEVGSGKTTICRWLARTLDPGRFAVVHLADPTLDARQLAFALAESLGAEVSRAEPELASSAISRKLTENADAGRQVVVLVDEAQAVPPDTLERLRLLSLPGEPGSPGARIVLLGPEELDQNLAAPELRAVRDRITQSFRLRRLTSGDVARYLRHRLKAAGYEGPPVFSDNAIRAIARLTGGVPRRINLLADKAMLSAALACRYTARTADIAVAAREIRMQRARPRQRMALIGSGAFACGAALAVALLWFAQARGLAPVPAELRMSASAAPRAANVAPTGRSAPARQAVSDEAAGAMVLGGSPQYGHTLLRGSN